MIIKPNFLLSNSETELRWFRKEILNEMEMEWASQIFKKLTSYVY